LPLHRSTPALPDAADERAALLRDLFGGIGKATVIRLLFHCDGDNIRRGRGVFLIFGCVLLDVVSIAFGNRCQIGSGVQILTADNPRDPALRREGYESGIPVRIGANVWIGSGAIILPGLTIGADAIIGAGSVVTRNVPPGATVMGNPASMSATKG
jgi:maltose O-acetyltransferase